MDIANLIKLDKLQQEGVWKELGAGIEVKLAAFGNAAMQTFVRTTGRKHRRAAAAGRLDDEVALELQKDAMAKHVLLDWKNLEEMEQEPDDMLEDEDFMPHLVPIPYSVEKARELLDIEPFYTAVFEMSQELAGIDSVHMEDILGNSSSSSAGS